jgi:hypothetical protein
MSGFVSSNSNAICESEGISTKVIVFRYKSFCPELQVMYHLNK